MNYPPGTKDNWKSAPDVGMMRDVNEARADLRRARYRIASLATAIGAAAVAGLVLIGWAAHNQFLVSVTSTLPAARPNAAVAVLILGVALVLHARSDGRVSVRIMQWLLAAASGAIAVATLLETALDRNFRIDTLLVEAGRFPVDPHPGRMSVMAALAILALAVAVSVSERLPMLGQSLAFATAALSTISLLGIVYAEGPVSQVSQAGVSLPGAISVLFASLSTAWMVPGRGPMMLLTADGAGGTLLRRLTVTVLPLPPILGWVITAITRHRHLDFNFAAAMIVVILSVVGSAAAWDAARRLQATDIDRNEAEGELADLNAELQRRVEQRTALLRGAEQRQRAISESARDAIIMADHAGVIRFANAAAEQLFGWPDDALIGHPTTSILPQSLLAEAPTDEPEPDSEDEDFIPTRVLETTALHHDGRVIPVELAVARWTQDGELWYAGTIRDLTSQKEADAARQ